jgi:hypothetical protein
MNMHSLPSGQCPLLPPIGLYISVLGANDANDGGPGKPCDSYHDPPGVSRGPGRGVEAVLIIWVDVHEVAERVVALILWAGQAFYRVGPNINNGAIGQGDKPMTRGSCHEIHQPHPSKPFLRARRNPGCRAQAGSAYGRFSNPQETTAFALVARRDALICRRVCGR